MDDIVDGSVTVMMTLASTATKAVNGEVEASRRETRVPGLGAPDHSLRLLHKRLQSFLSPRCPLGPLGPMGSHLCKQQSVECVCDE